MKIALVIFFVSFVCGQRPPGEFETFPKGYNDHVTTDESIEETELVLAFVIFRHGDRTPDQEEMALFSEKFDKKIFFPYGPKALTNKGKQRSYAIGQYLRRRYDGFISHLYLPEEVVVWTTDYDRTKMTALAALAALYEPPPAQKWNPALDWQPVPYNTMSYDEDDLLYWYNCDRYLWLRDQMYNVQHIKNRIEPYKPFMKFLSEKTGHPITTPEDVFFLSNLFQASRNVGVPAPQWALDHSSKIKEMTRLEYEVEFHHDELIRLASGVIMSEIRNATKLFVSGHQKEGRKLRLYSGHENNVAGLMAAARVFDPHQPPYGATFSLELRRKKDGGYGILAVYAVDPASSGRILPIDGCGDTLLCDYRRFLNLTKEYVWTKEEFKNQCARKTLD